MVLEYFLKNLIVARNGKEMDYMSFGGVLGGERGIVYIISLVDEALLC